MQGKEKRIPKPVQREGQDRGQHQPQRPGLGAGAHTGRQQAEPRPRLGGLWTRLPFCLLAGPSRASYSTSLSLSVPACEMERVVPTAPRSGASLKLKDMHKVSTTACRTQRLLRTHDLLSTCLLLQISQGDHRRHQELGKEVPESCEIGPTARSQPRRHTSQGSGRRHRAPWESRLWLFKSWPRACPVWTTDSRRGPGTPQPQPSPASRSQAFPNPHLRAPSKVMRAQVWQSIMPSGVYH